ncbi:hypothetical protein LINPERPRIM_LOCUS6800 [Linum perenne]
MVLLLRRLAWLREGDLLVTLVASVLKPLLQIMEDSQSQEPSSKWQILDYRWLGNLVIVGLISNWIHKLQY